jgi:hypothetical protein
VLRDAEHHALAREVSELRFGPAIARWREGLGVNLAPPQRALLGLALGYFTWRRLAREEGLGSDCAAAVMAKAIEGAEEN